MLRGILIPTVFCWLLAGCVTLLGPSHKDFGDFNTAKFDATDTSTMKSTTESYANTTRTKFDEWQREYVRVNRANAGVLTVLAYAGAVAAGYDASKDVLKGIGFGAGGVVTLENFLKTEHGSTVLLQAQEALACADRLNSVRLSASKKVSNLTVVGKQLRNEYKNAKSLADTAVHISSANGLSLSQSIRDRITEARVHAQIAVDDRNSTIRFLNNAIGELSRFTPEASWRSYWENIESIRNEVVTLLIADAVNLEALFESVTDDVNGSMKDVVDKLKAAQVAAKVQRPNEQGEALKLVALMESNSAIKAKMGNEFFTSSNLNFTAPDSASTNLLKKVSNILEPLEDAILDCSVRNKKNG